jgi:hypothetical protein
MRIDISPADISSLALQKVDAKRLLTLLFESDTVNGAPSPFESVSLYTSWGLLVCVFHTFRGQNVILPCFTDILAITKDLVINDAGQRVDRYQKLVEELLKVATEKLRGQGILQTRD